MSNVVDLPGAEFKREVAGLLVSVEVKITCEKLVDDDLVKAELPSYFSIFGEELIEHSEQLFGSMFGEKLDCDVSENVSQEEYLSCLCFYF